VDNFAIIDLKTGFEMLPSTAIQMSAYENIYVETLKRKTDIGLTFEEENHLYKLNGTGLVSVTQVLQKAGIIDFSKVPPQILEAARKFGTAAHKACELFDKGTLDERSLDHNLWPYLDGWVAFKKEYNFEFLAIEQPIGSTIYRVAGTPDRIAKSDKRRRLAVLLGPEGTYKVTEYTNKGDWQVFLAALSVVNWKEINLK
jgi:hypothetical protein